MIRANDPTPKRSLEQMVRIVPFSEWKGMVVACSGGFNIERAVRQVYPDLPILSSDVSLVTVALGRLLTGDPLTFTFHDKLAFIEEHLDDDPVKRFAALLVAMSMAGYKGKSEYHRMHREYYRDNFAECLDKAMDITHNKIANPPTDEFQTRDMHEMPGEAKERGWGIVSAPPFYGGDYEALYRWIGDSIQWEEPEYRLWDPNNLSEWVATFPEQWAVFANHTTNMPMPCASFSRTPYTPFFLFTSYGDKKSGYDENLLSVEPFKFEAIDAAAFKQLREDSQIELMACTRGQFHYLRTLYSTRAISYSSALWRFVVRIDGKVAGAFGLTAQRDPRKTDSLHVMSDFSVLRGRLSKLIVMLMTSRDVIAPIERQVWHQIDYITTLTFTEKHTSMKYRGEWEILKKDRVKTMPGAPDKGYIVFKSDIRDQSLQEIYAHWWRRWSELAPKKASRRGRRNKKKQEAVADAAG